MQRNVNTQIIRNKKLLGFPVGTFQNTQTDTKYWASWEILKVYVNSW